VPPSAAGAYSTAGWARAAKQAVSRIDATKAAAFLYAMGYSGSFCRWGGKSDEMFVTQTVCPIDIGGAAGRIYVIVNK
jgi:hypothetical protein